jgi:hypothetical protein
MDYQKIEDEFFSFYKDEIIYRLKKEFKGGRPFPKAIDNTRNYLIDIKNDGIINNNQRLLNDCIYYINHRLDEYKEEVALHSIITNEIKDEFDKKKNDLVPDENSLLQITFDDFAKELIKYDCLTRIDLRLSKFSEYFKTFYIRNDYRGFTLNIPENYKVLENKKEDKESDKPNEDILYKLQQFEENEKLLILHALFQTMNRKSRNNNIDLPEFLRIIRICQGLEDTSLFEENYVKKQYKRVDEGLKYSSNTKNKQLLKQTTIDKLKDLKVTEIETFIKQIKIN